MAYQNTFNNNAIGMQGQGFASHRKGNHVKRLSVAPPANITTIDEVQANDKLGTPRTARGHLLAGLRTAPKSATVPHAPGLESSRYASQPSTTNNNNNRPPKTATGAFFPNRGSGYGQHQGYTSPEQVLAPPVLDLPYENSGMDQSFYDELVATNNYLAQQQRALQQQLLNVQAAAQQFGGLSINGGVAGYQPLQSAVSPSPMSMYNQQFQQGLQPVVTPVSGQSGMFMVYNPMTGQSSYVYDNSAIPTEVTSPHASLTSPVDFNGRRHSPLSTMSPPVARSASPPKRSVASPVEVEPLPPPSSNAFRRGHRKALSSANVKTGADGSRSTTEVARPTGIPATPMTGAFGPGQARAGEHPVRQPRNPPHLSELQDKPTSKHAGSINFATRQRRHAVKELVKAGRERLSHSESGSPSSEQEFNFSVSSEDNEILGRSGDLSSKPSSGSLAAIGSERKEKHRERNSVDSTGSVGAKSLSSDEGHSVGGDMVEVDSSRRKAPLLVLSSAEKRKSVAF